MKVFNVYVPALKTIFQVVALNAEDAEEIIISGIEDRFDEHTLEHIIESLETSEGMYIN